MIVYGEKARKLMRSAKINTNDFAQRHEFSSASVFNWLNLPYPPSDFIAVLCKDLGMSMSEFWNDGSGSIVNPVVRPIVEELNRIADTIPEREQDRVFSMVLEGLKSVK